MSQTETVLFFAFITFLVAAFALHQLVIFKVNKHSPPDTRLANYLSGGGWEALAKEYNDSYPKSSLHQFALSCAIGAFIVAASLLAVRAWDLFGRR